MHNGMELKHPWHAVALSLLGYRCYARSFLREHTGQKNTVWYAAGRDLQKAAMVIEFAALPADHAHHLGRLVPEHPFLMALYALEARENLEHWQRTGLPCAVVRPHPQGRLLRVLRGGAAGPHDLLPHVWATAQRVAAIRDVAAVAATIVGGGFVPHPGVTAEGWAFANESLTQAGVTLGMLPQAHTAPLPGGYPPGGHPFQWALSALRKQAQLLTAHGEAQRNPSVLMRGVGQRTAMVSASLLEPSAPRSLRDRLPLHLKGITQ